MICPGCEGKNRDGARFCTFCGENLALRCSVCDAELIPEARFCDSCGAAVGVDVQAVTPAVAARKVVTVLFADLTGSTALEERMDAESVRSILDRFYAAMRTEIERHGGRVVKFTGDGAMAAFGVPEVHEDDAARAVDAALAMRNELEQLASDLSLDLSLKIGINTGEVVVSASDDDVVGDAVNVASRLEGAATAGEVLVGEDTWRLTRSTSRYESVPPLTLKGKSEPVPAYRLLAVDERTAEAATAPFVGRDAELRKLLQVFEECVEANAARLVTIVGSPGLGKTRLARELMTELSEQATVQETRCDPAGSATFAPIAEALRNATGITETNTEEEIVAVLAAALPEDDPDRDKIAARAAAILGAGQPGSTEETFWALRRLIEAAARIQPVVIVLDDMHWAEPLLFDFVEHITEWIRDAPVLFVGTGRPELRDIRPSLVEGGRAAAVISLEGLNQDATTQLALNLLGAEDLPGELLAKIPASTEGNPLFVRELVRMLVDDGVLLRTAEGWTVTVDVEAIQVPPTIQSLLSARVDRLRGDERAVLELASVVGKEFYRGALVDLAPANVRDLVDGVLESLRRKELVEPVGTYWIDEPVFRFHHVLIRDAAYRRLLKESRGDLHERVAEWLEVKTADVLGEHDELIGYHLEQAHDYKKQLGRPDVELGRRAAALLGTAARRALDSDDLPAAAGLSGRALDCLPTDDEGRADLLIVRCEALLSIGDVSAGTTAVTELESVADTPRLSAWATCFSGQLANLTSSERLHETEERVAAAAAELSALGDQAGAAKANTVRAAALAALGRFADCEDVLDIAKNAAQAAKNNRLITATLGALPHVALWGPSPVSRAGGRCLDTIRLLRITTGSKAVEEMSRRCQAVLEALRGRSDAARGMLRRARRTLMELGLEHELLETELLEGIVELVSSDPAAAIVHLRSAHDGFRATGVDVLAAQSAALLARAHLALGEDDEAESFVGTSEHLGAQDLKTAIAWRSVRAELLARRGEFDDARRLADEAVELASRTDALVDQGDAYRSLAAVCVAAGDASGARAANERATSLYERKGATALIDARIASTTPSSPIAEVSADDVVAVSALSNDATLLFQRMLAAFDARDFAEVAACCADDILHDQRRPLFNLKLVGVDEQVETMKQVAYELEALSEATPVAIRGQRLGLVRQRFFPADESRGGFEYELLVLLEMNENHLLTSNIYYELDDLDIAIAELEKRYAAGEGARSSSAGIHLENACSRAAETLMERIRILDWEGVGASYAAGVVIEDRRRNFRGHLVGREAMVAQMQEGVRVGARNVEVTAIAIRGEQVALSRFLAVDPTGRSSFEVELLGLHVLDDDGLISFGATFDPEDLDGAIAEMDERFVAGEGQVHSKELHLTAKFSRALNSRDWDALEGILTDDLVVIDHRPAWLGGMDRNRLMDSWRALAGIYEFRTDIATYQGLADGRVLLHWLVGGQTEEGALIENPFHLMIGFRGGQIDYMELFSIDDRDAALARFEELVRRPATLSSLAAATMSRMTQANVERDWDTLSALSVEGSVWDDRRAGLQTTLVGPEAQLANFKAVADSGVRDIETRIVAIRGNNLALGRLVFVIGDSKDRLEVEVLFALEVEPSGRMVAAWIFDAADIDTAIAKLDERYLETVNISSSPELTNTSVAAFDRTIVLTEARDWEGFRKVLSGDTAMFDRRPGVAKDYIGRDAVVEAAVALDSISARVTRRDVLATRGERLSLLRVLVGSGDESIGFESELLVVSEVDNAGLLLWRSIFEPENIDEAFVELEERFFDGEGAASEEIHRLGLRLISAVNTQDWEAMRTLLAEDVVISDHRRTGSGDIAVDPFVVGSQNLTGITGSFRVDMVRDIALAPTLALVEALSSGASEEGGDFEIPSLAVVACREDRLTRIELFEIDQREQALALFDELNDQRSTSRPRDNRCSRVMSQVVELSKRREWESARPLYAPSYSLEDRRSVLSSSLDTEDALKGLGYPDIGELSSRFQLLATRGERLALHRITIEMDEFEIEFLGVNGIDEEGRLNGAVLFDADDLDAAFEEVDNRYLSGEGAPCADVVRCVTNTVRLFNARDWDAYRQSISDDAVFISHQRVSVGETYGVDAWMDVLRAMADLLESQRMHIISVLAISEELGLGEVFGFGTSTEGVDVEFGYLALAQIRDGRVCRTETFETDDVDAALARFEELGREEPVPRVLENAASRVHELHLELSRMKDWDGLAASIAEDVVIEDRRPGFAWRIEGRQSAVEHSRVATVDTSFLSEVLAIRGDRLVLSRLLSTTKDFEVELLVLTEINEAGLQAATVMFETGDLDNAIAELDSRFATMVDAEGAGASVEDAQRPFDLENACTRACQRYLDAFNAHDWEGVVASLAEDVRTSDRRVGMRNEIRGRDEALKQYSMWSTDPAGAVLSQEILALRGERFALFSHSYSIGRPEFEIEFLAVVAVDGQGRRVDVVYFDPDDIRAAFDELDDRYLASDESEPNDHVWIGLFKAYNSRDWTAFKSLVTDDYRYIDHQPAGRDDEGVDESIEYMQGLIDLVPDLYLASPQVLRRGGDLILGRAWIFGTDVNGSYIEFEPTHLGVFRDGKTARLESFPAHRFSDALARYDELRDEARDRPAVLENSATRAIQGYLEAFGRREWAAMEAHFVPDALSDDRRSGVSMATSTREELVGQFRTVCEIAESLTDELAAPEEVASLRVTAEWIPIAIRGERLALIRLRVGTASHDPSKNLEAHVLNIYEVDETGLITASIGFDEGDLDSALTELNERYLADTNVPVSARVFLKWCDAMNERDWEAFRDIHSASLERVDNRLEGMPPIFGRDEIVNFAQIGVELMPDSYSYIVSDYRVTERGAVGLVRTTGTNEDGGRVDREFVAVCVLDDEGRIARIADFQIDEVDAAITCFEELERIADETPASALTNECSRVFDRVLSLFEARDWPQMAELYSEDFYVESRRAVLQHEARGREGSLEGWVAAADVGATRTQASVIATRDERRALTSVRFKDDDDSADAFVTDVMFLNELDGEGRIVSALLLDPDDFDKAFDELDKRWLASPEATDACRAAVEFIRAYRDQDLEGLRATLADDFVHVDHRPASFGEQRGREPFLDLFQVLAELVSDISARLLAVYPVGESCVVAVWRREAVDEQGGAVFWENVTVGVASEGRATRMEHFLPEDLEKAVARAEELDRSSKI